MKTGGKKITLFRSTQETPQLHQQEAQKRYVRQYIDFISPQNPFQKMYLNFQTLIDPFCTQEETQESLMALTEEMIPYIDYLLYKNPEAFQSTLVGAHPELELLLEAPEIQDMKEYQRLCTQIRCHSASLLKKSILELKPPQQMERIVQFAPVIADTISEYLEEQEGMSVSRDSKHFIVLVVMHLLGLSAALYKTVDTVSQAKQLLDQLTASLKV